MRTPAVAVAWLSRDGNRLRRRGPRGLLISPAPESITRPGRGDGARPEKWDSPPRSGIAGAMAPAHRFAAVGALGQFELSTGSISYGNASRSAANLIHSTVCPQARRAPFFISYVARLALLSPSAAAMASSSAIRPAATNTIIRSVPTDQPASVVV